jgi:hypothetical protein
MFHVLFICSGERWIGDGSVCVMPVEMNDDVFKNIAFTNSFISSCHSESGTPCRTEGIVGSKIPFSVKTGSVFCD